jgi:HSP20 family protein
MAITRYRDRNVLSPWRDLDQVADQFSRIFGEPVFAGVEGSSWLPPVNVEETKDHLVLTAELPGLKRDDVEIELENNVLTIRGQKQETREEDKDDRKVHVWERRYGSFQRAFSLPRTVSADDISATFENGVLRVEMPKAAEAKGRTIEIRTHS